MIYLVSVAGFVTFVLLIRWLSGRPIRFRGIRPERLRELLQALYFRGFDGATLVMQARAWKPLAVVEKEIIADNNVQLACTLFGGPELVPVMNEVVRSLPTVTAVAAAKRGAVARLELGSDRDHATRVLIEICGRVYGVDIASEAVVYLTNMHPSNVRIGWTH